MSWYNSKSRQTKAYEEYVLLNLINSTVSDVSLKENLGYFTITGIIDRYIGAAVNWAEIQRLDVIGLDEISLKKGNYSGLKEGCLSTQMSSPISGSSPLKVASSEGSSSRPCFFSVERYERVMQKA